MHTDWINDILLCNYNQTGRSLPRVEAFGMLIVRCSNIRFLGWYRQGMESAFESYDGTVNHWHTR